ncbi:MAG: HAD-IA family hydrolase [Thermoanaerobaculia bacterium]|nr:HAD-IA family hydrolase [Thermoanaerobaculia bacterium]
MSANAPHDAPTPACYDLIVLDWDGTVMDSLGAIVACARHALREARLPELSEELIRGGIGLGLEATVERLLPDLDGEVRRQWIQAYRDHWISTYQHQPVLLRGARSAVVELNHREYMLAVATGKGRRGLQRDLDELDMDRLFLASRTVDEAPSKPNPQMLLELMDELGVRADRTLMVGDTTYDLDMAKNAGVVSVAVLTGGHDRQTLTSRDPLACLASLADLPEWLESSR